MCRTCGCDGVEHVHDHPHVHPPRRISLEADLLGKNDRLAHALRDRFVHDEIVTLNLIGAPGAGKTTLLEHTLRALPDIPISVIEGDQATDHDARRIAATGRRAVQVNTGAGCHLEATMIERGLGELQIAPRSLLFVENVGNLVCPAEFVVGEHARAMVFSITEGEEKPLKYPVMFRTADLVVINKIDLLPYLDFDLDAFYANLRAVNPSAAVMEVSAKTGQGLDEWCAWLTTVTSQSRDGA